MRVLTRLTVGLVGFAMQCLVWQLALASPFDFIHPEAAGSYSEKPEVLASQFLISAANPLAAEAGYDILKEGGGAIDAAIAAQLVLNLVEPQSSGIGGGAFIVYYDRASHTVFSYDGRETAPAAVSTELFVDDKGRSLTYPEAVNSGLSVGVPGLLRVLEMAHEKHGLLPWAHLFRPAIQLAEQGFAVSPRLHMMLSRNRGLADQKAAKSYFYNEEGQPWPVGHILKNPEFAETLRELALEGPDAFYRGDIAQSIVMAVRDHKRPGWLTLDDLASYQAIERPPLCGQHRQFTLCGIGPPSSGTVGVLQMLGLLSQVPIADLSPLSAEAVHYFSEAGRLAYADRDYYLGDPDQVDVPVEALLEAGYLRSRAALMQADATLGVAPPGDPYDYLPTRGKDSSLELPSTTHISVVDSWGDMLSMTSTIESAFGSKIWVRGFLLNNELTDFSLSAADGEGRPVANRVEPGKRPRSTMTPLLIFREGKPYMAIGSPGGSSILNYVAQAVVGVLDWGLSIQEAVSLPHYGSRNKATELERGRGLDHLTGPLQEKGHTVELIDFSSGLQAVLKDSDGVLHGGADPRREGVALGD